MRTFGEIISHLLGNTRSSDGRKYMVQGKLSFWMRNYPNSAWQPDMAAITEAIREVDAQFPWDDEPLSGQEWHSIRCLGEGQIVKHNWSRGLPEVVVWFMLTPGRHYMRRSQIYAYEKYLQKLAEELSKRGLPFTHQVGCVLETSSVTMFERKLSL